MRWTTKEPKDKSEWHRWFAWHPVQLTGTRTWVWREYVERKQESDWWETFWAYQDITGDATDAVGT